MIGKEWVSRAPRFGLLLLLAIGVWGGGYLRRGLWEPDEARYAYVAREMHAGGHWFVPHVNGRLYPDKPPLMFWLINAASGLTGGEINGLSARLPSLLGTVLSLWAIGRMMTRWCSAAAGWRAVLILSSTFLFWQEAGWGRIDALLCGLVMMSLYSFDRSLVSQRLRYELLAYLWAGLAVLAKGPVGIIVPVGIFAVMAPSAGEGARLRRLHWIWGPCVALIIPAAWLGVAWFQHAPGEYFAALFGEKSFGRAIQSTGHARPFYYYLAHVAVEALPWALLLPGAWLRLEDRALRRRLTAWVAFVLLFFSLLVCKRNVYILSVYPAAAMLIAAAWPKLAAEATRATRGIAWCLMGLLALAGVAALVAICLPMVPVPGWALAPSAVALLGGAGVLIHIYRRERLAGRWFAAWCTVLLLNLTLISTLLFPALNPLKAPLTIREEAQARLKPDEHVYLYAVQLAIIPLYAQRPGRQLDDIQELWELMDRQTHGLYVFRERQWREVAPLLRHRVTSHTFPMGNKQIVWFEFPEADQAQ